MGDYIDLFDAWTVISSVFPADAEGKIRLAQSARSRPSYGNYPFEWRAADVGSLLENAANRRGEDDIHFGVALYERTARDRGAPSSLPALWLRRSQPDFDSPPPVEIPPSLTIADVCGREAFYGWLLNDALAPEAHDEIVRVLARRAGSDFEPVLAHGFVRLPDCGHHGKPMSVLVQLREINDHRYDSAELRALLLPGHGQ